MSQEGGGFLSMMKGWAKFKPPPNFVQKEQQLKTMDPGEKLSMEYILNQLDTLISNSSGGVKTQYEAIKADIIVDQKKNAYAEEFIEDFILWILGRSCKNIKYEHEEFDPNGRRVVDLDPPVEITPWGNTPYTHLDDVSAFLDQIVDNRMAAIKYIAKLKLRYPRNLAELWFWWKYIVHKQGVDGAIINYARWLEQYDFIPPDKVPLNTLDNPMSDTYTYFDMGEGNDWIDRPYVYVSASPLVTRYHVENPNPPPYLPERAKALMEAYEAAMSELDDQMGDPGAYVPQSLEIFDQMISRNAYAFCKMDMEKIRTRIGSRIMGSIALTAEQKTDLLNRLGLLNVPDQGFVNVQNILQHHIAPLLPAVPFPNNNIINDELEIEDIDINDLDWDAEIDLDSDDEEEQIEEVEEVELEQEQQPLPPPPVPEGWVQGFVQDVLAQGPMVPPAPIQMNYVFAPPPPPPGGQSIKAGRNPGYLRSIQRQLKDNARSFSDISKYIQRLDSTNTRLEYALSSFASSKSDEKFKNEVTSVINSLVDRSNSNDIIMADLEKKIGSSYPDVTLSIPKDFNKEVVSSIRGLSSTIRSLISTYEKKNEDQQMAEQGGQGPPPPPGPPPESFTNAINDLQRYLTGALEKRDKLGVSQARILRGLAESIESMDYGGISSKLDKTLASLTEENTNAYNKFISVLEKGYGKEASSSINQDMNSSEISEQISTLQSQRAEDLVLIQNLTNAFNKASLEKEQISESLSSIQSNYEKIQRDQRALQNLSSVQRREIGSLIKQNIALNALKESSSENYKTYYEEMLSQNTQLLKDIKNQNIRSAEQERLLSEARAAQNVAVNAEKVKYDALSKKHSEEISSLQASLTQSQREVTNIHNLMKQTESLNQANITNLQAQYNQMIFSLQNQNASLFSQSATLKSQALDKIHTLQVEKDFQVEEMKRAANSRMSSLMYSVQNQIQEHQFQAEQTTRQMQMIMMEKDQQIREYQQQDSNFRALAERVRQLETADPSEFNDALDITEQLVIPERELSQMVERDIAVLLGQAEEAPIETPTLPLTGLGSDERLAMIARELDIDAGDLEDSPSVRIEEVIEERSSPGVVSAVTQLSELDKITQKRNLVNAWSNKNPQLQAQLRQKYGVAENNLMVVFRNNVNQWAEHTGNANLSEERRIEKFGEKLEAELPPNTSRAYIDRLSSMIMKAKRQTSIQNRISKVRGFITSQSEVGMDAGGNNAPAPNYSNIGDSLNNVLARIAPTEDAAKQLGFQNTESFYQHYLTEYNAVRTASPNISENEARQLFLRNAAQSTYQNLLGQKSSQFLKNLLDSFNGNALKSIQNLSTFVGSKFNDVGNPLLEVQKMIKEIDTGDNAKALVTGTGQPLPSGQGMAEQTFDVFRAILEIENLTVPLRDLAAMGEKHFQDSSTKTQIEQLIAQVENMQQVFVSGLSGDIRDLVKAMSDAGAIPLRDVLKGIGTILKTSATRAGYNEEELESAELDNLAEAGTADAGTLQRNEQLLMRVHQFAENHYRRIKNSLASNVITRKRSEYAKLVSEGRTPEYYFSGSEVTDVLNSFLDGRRNGNELLSRGQIELPGARPGSKNIVNISEAEQRALEVKLNQYRARDLSDEEISEYLQKYFGRYSQRPSMTPQEMTNFNLPEGTPHIPVTDRTNARRRVVVPDAAQRLQQERERKRMAEQERIAAHGQRLRQEAEERRRNAPPQSQQRLNTTPGGTITMDEIERRAKVNETHAYNSILTKMGLNQVKNIPVKVLESLLETRDGNAMLEKRGVTPQQIRLAREAFRRNHPKAEEENIVVSSGQRGGERQRVKA